MKNSTNIEIQVSEDISQGVFSNLAILNHSDSEFTMDFIYMQPSQPRGRVRSRVIMTAAHLKRFSLALEDNIKKFEERFGEIKIAADTGGPDMSAIWKDIPIPKQG